MKLAYKIGLGVLGAALVGGAYYKFVYLPGKEKEASDNGSTGTTGINTVDVSPKKNVLQALSNLGDKGAAMDVIKASGSPLNNLNFHNTTFTPPILTTATQSTQSNNAALDQFMGNTKNPIITTVKAGQGKG